MYQFPGQVIAHLIASESQTCCYLAYYFLLTCGTTFKVNIVGILFAIEMKTLRILMIHVQWIGLMPIAEMKKECKVAYQVITMHPAPLVVSVLFLYPTMLHHIELRLYPFHFIILSQEFI